MITSRQHKRMSELIENFTQADKKHGFNINSMAFYIDRENEMVIVKTDYSRTLVNVIDGDVNIYVIDKKGQMQPLSIAMSSINEQLKYLEKLEVINQVK